MKVQFRVSNEVTVAFETEKISGVFQFVSKCNDLLACKPCGKCNSPSALNFRSSKGYKFHEWKCQNPNCGATLAIRQHKEDQGGGLYRRQDEQWSIYVPETDGVPVIQRGNDYEQARQVQQPATQPPAPAAAVPDDEIPF